MTSYHERLKRKIRDRVKSAEVTAPFASEATQARINAKRADAAAPNGGNKAVSDALTGTDRAKDGRRTVGETLASGPAVPVRAKADYTAAYNDSSRPVCPVTGVSMDPLSAYTRPQVYRVPPDIFEDLKRVVAVLKLAGRTRGWAQYARHGGVQLCMAGEATFLVGKGTNNRWIACHLNKDGTTSMVIRDTRGS